MLPESTRGASLVEVLIGTMGLVLVVTLALRSLSDLAVQAEAQRVRVARVQSTRIARSVLRAEVGGAMQAGGLALYPPDSIHLRAFRGMAYVCSAPSDSVVGVQWIGRRAPVPAKDSVRVLLRDGRWVATDLVQVTAAEDECGNGAGVASSWRLRPGVPGAVLLRLFEPGSYHLVDGALRYRSGRSGRQPITESTLEGAGVVRRGGIILGEWPVLSSGERTTLYLGRTRIPE